KDKVFGLNTPLDPIVTAYVLQVSRRSLEPSSFEELSSVTGANKHKTGQCHKDLVCYFMKTATDGAFNASQPVLGPSEPLQLRFIRRYSRSLGLSGHATALATRLSQVAHTEKVTTPSVVAASTMLFATAVAGENEAIEDVGIVSSTSPRQLRLGFEKLRSMEGLVHEGFVDAVMPIYGIDRQAACKKLYPKQPR
ncbi:hypothetical protein FRB95_000959, partial [Tulasnella sp. JGI-2019a]